MLDNPDLKSGGATNTPHQGLNQQTDPLCQSSMGMALDKTSYFPSNASKISSGALQKRFCGLLGRVLRSEEISQKELAGLINTSPQAVNNWLTGKNLPDFDNMREIIRVCQHPLLLNFWAQCVDGNSTVIGEPSTPREIIDLCLAVIAHMNDGENIQAGTVTEHNRNHAASSLQKALSGYVEGVA